MRITEIEVEDFLKYDQFQYKLIEVNEIWLWYYNNYDTELAQRFKETYSKIFGINLDKLSKGIYNKCGKITYFDYWGTIIEDILTLTSSEDVLTYIDSKKIAFDYRYKDIIRRYLTNKNLDKQKINGIFGKLEILIEGSLALKQKKQAIIDSNAQDDSNKSEKNTVISKKQSSVIGSKSNQLSVSDLNNCSNITPLTKQEAVSISNKLFNYLRNGIQVNGTTRKFDIVDYYLLTNTKCGEMLKLIKQEINVKKFHLIAIFFKKNSDDRLFSFNAVLKDRNVFMIDGVMHEVTEEEKNTAMQYLRLHSIKADYTTYRCALMRVLYPSLYEENIPKEFTTEDSNNAKVKKLVK